MERVKKLNEDPAIDGILVQLPLPKHIDEAVVSPLTLISLSLSISLAMRFDGVAAWMTERWAQPEGVGRDQR